MSANKLSLVVNPEPKPRRRPRRYSDEEKVIALAAVDLNGHNVYRTSVALGIPAQTLADWVNDRAGRAAEFTEARKEKRGDLAAKLESLVHSIVEAMPGKVEKATLSQCAVSVGIGIDKIRVLHEQDLKEDPGTTLCTLLKINRAQLPTTLQLQPGEELPPGFEDIIETKTNAEGVIEPITDAPISQC